MRLAAQKEGIEAENSLVRRTCCSVFVHKTNYTKLGTFCKENFFTVEDAEKKSKIKDKNDK